MLKGEDKSERPMKKINKLLKRAKLKVYDQSWKEEREFRKPTQDNKQEEESPILKIFKSWMCSRNQIFDFINNLESKFLLACVKKLQIWD